MESVIMSAKDLVRMQILNDIAAGKRSTDDAADIFKVSERTVKRMCERVNEKGLLGLVHGNRGKAPSNKRCPKECARIIKIVRSELKNFNISHARDKLKEDYNIKISYGSLRKLMLSIGPLKRGKRRPKKKRIHRDRMPRFGMLLQMDGSPHLWNGTDKWCCIGAIDDATSALLHAEFFKSETTLACMTVLENIVNKYGIPKIFYVDRAGLFGGLKRQEFCQFGRACEELGIKIIFANSPQAKGRIERAWQTLQDRLVAELEYNSIKEMGDANSYLQDVFIPEYWNKKLTVKPEQSASEFGVLPEGVSIKDVCSVRFYRNVSNSNTVSIDSDLFRINAKPGQEVPVTARTEIFVRQNGTMEAKIRGEFYPITKLPKTSKAPLSHSKMDAKRASRAAPGGGPLLRREGPPQAQTTDALAPSTVAQGDEVQSSSESVEHLKVQKKTPKGRLDKVA